jgi:hypothetical protein
MERIVDMRVIGVLAASLMLVASIMAGVAPSHICSTTKCKPECCEVV